MSPKQSSLLKYLFFDILSAFVVWVLFMYFRQIVNDGKLFEHVQVFIPKYNFFSSLLVYPIFCLFVHWLSGFYINPLSHNKTNDFLTTFSSSVIISITIFFLLLLDDVVVDYQQYYYSLLVLLGLQLGITLTFRLIITSRIQYNYRRKHWSINTAIVGDGFNAQRIAGEIQMNSDRNTIIGFVSERRQRPSKQPHTAFPILGDLSQIEKLITQHRIEEVIIALDENDEQKLYSIINTLFRFNIEIRFTARIHEILTGSAEVERPGISPLVSITSLSMPDWQICVKRFFDISISAFSLSILSPLLLLFSIWIKIDSRGSIFYKQERLGRNGIPFNILKFRTMKAEAENGLPQLSSAHDERVTSAGKILRKYRLDEIPQFWNVLKGEMSLVGPRPERRYYIEKIMQSAPYYCLIYKIRPGLTSWGPIRIGYSDSIEKMIERLNYDLVYMDKMSLMVDLKILLLTFEVIFRGKGV